MIKFDLSYKPFGEKAILIEWPSEINEEVLNDIVTFKGEIEKNIQLQDLIIGYNSLMLVYKFVIEKITNKIDFLDKLYQQKKESERLDVTHWKIPVCYDISFGIDLELISKANNLSKEEIIHLHSSAIYTVYFIGFLPGFLYLGGLDSRLNIPRKNIPRLRVSKGAVGIGGKQTGIYPTESSGGWNIIGNSPINLFDVNKETPCFAKTGDKISFYSITLREYKQLEKAIKKNNYQVETIL